MKTDEELKQIALDLFQGKIYSSAHLKNEDAHMLPSVFMALGMMKPEDRKAMAKKEPHFIYEYLNKAGPRSINGKPCFFSFRWLNKEESEKMWEYHAQIKESVDGVLKPQGGEKNG